MPFCQFVLLHPGSCQFGVSKLVPEARRLGLLEDNNYVLEGTCSVETTTRDISQQQQLPEHSLARKRLWAQDYLEDAAFVKQFVVLTCILTTATQLKTAGLGVKTDLFRSRTDLSSIYCLYFATTTTKGDIPHERSAHFPRED
jgi:hypothetical protein